MVLTPLFFSLIIAIFNSNRISNFLFLLSVLLNIALLPSIYNDLIINNEIIYLLGDYSNKVGIEVKLNFFSFIFLTIFNISLLGFTFYKSKQITYLQNILFLFCIVGFNGILMSNDLFNIYVFLELASIASYALIASFNNLNTVKAAFDYLIFGTIGAGFYLVGVAFLYMLSGTLNISELLRFTEIFNGYSSGFLWLSLSFILLGFLIKLGIFPLHRWLFKVYYETPAFLTSFFSMTSSITSIYILLIFIFNIYDITNITAHLQIPGLLQFVGLSSAIFFGFTAFQSKNNKEILIYSSLADMGYLLNSIGIITNYQNKIGGSMIILQLTTGLLTKPILFILLSDNIFEKIQSKFLQKTHFFITNFFILNLIGIPPFLGFFGKFALFTYIVQEENWINLFFIVIATIFSCLYGIRLFDNLQISHKDQISNSNGNKYYLTQILPASCIFIFSIVFILIFSNQIQSLIDLATKNLLIKR